MPCCGQGREQKVKMLKILIPVANAGQEEREALLQRHHKNMRVIEKEENVHTETL